MAKKKSSRRGKKKQLSDAFKNPKTKGALHRQLGVPEDETIPMETLIRASKSKNLKLKQRAMAALNMIRSSGKSK
jgi:hypothetical protein